MINFERISGFIGEALPPAAVNRRRLLIVCLAVFVVAAGVRLLHWQNSWLMIDNMMNKTAARYQEEAQFLLERDFKAFARGRSAEPDTGMLIHTPGYPIVIAAVHAVTRKSNLALRLAHIAAGAAAAVLVLLIAAELLPLGAAALAGLFAAISPQLSFYSLVLLPDSIISLTILLGVYLLVRAAARGAKAWMIIGSGLAFGISCWLRANVLLLAPFLCLLIPILFLRQMWFRYAVLLVGATALMVLPITIRNAIVYQALIPLTLGTGTNLIEGIADYDPGKRFGMEQYDHEVTRQEAVLYNRPDYADELYRPDGILRERLRIRRATEVISANKVWFMRVMARRAAKMLTYEPVSIISAEHSISHLPDAGRGELIWRATPANTQDFTSDPVKAQPNSDFLLVVALKNIAGRAVIKVVRAETGKTIGSAAMPDSLSPDSAASGFPALQVPFVNSNADQLRIIVQQLDHPVEVGAIELYRLGPASYLWTKYPRILVKPLQKYFTTRWMLPLTLLGVGLLAISRRFDVLAIICAVPIYFIVTHAPIHLELRYILPVHYFWGMLVAVALYFMFVVAGKLLHKLKQSRNHA